MSGEQRRRRQQRRQGRRASPATGKETRGKRLPIGPWELAAGIGVALIVALGIIYFAMRPSPAAAPSTPTTQSSTVAPRIDGIGCNNMEQLAYHIHQHLALYVNGKLLPVPSSIGIPGGEMAARCFYWIHVHMLDPGMIHVESPRYQTYHLGNFFDIWKATAATTSPRGDGFVKKLEAAKPGSIHVFYNGKRWTRGYRSVPLTDHAVITVEIGTPVIPPQTFVGWHGES